MPSVRWSSLAALVLTSLAIMGSPGPATISLTGSGVAFGVRRSARYLAGIILGTTAVLAGGFFITSLFLSWLASYDRKPSSIVIPASQSQPAGAAAPIAMMFLR